MTKYRIVENLPDFFSVEKKRWYGWHVLDFYDTLAEARNGLDRHSFVPKTVYEVEL